MTIAVTGATGQLGRLVIDALKGRGAQPVALARSPGNAGKLDATVRAFDYDRPETLAPALGDVDTLLLVSGSEIGRRTGQHRAVIEAARAAGVERIVYTSVLRADTSPLDLAADHRDTERALTDSGLGWTLLRNGWYTENYTDNLAPVLEHGVLVGAAGDGRFAAATRRDYAEAAAVVLAEDGHAGRTYELAGDESWTLGDLAAELSRQTARDIAYHPMSEAEYADVLKGAGLPSGLAEALAGYEADAAKGALESDSTDLSRLIGRPTTPLSEALRAALLRPTAPARRG